MKMVKKGLSEDVVAEMVQIQPVKYVLTPDCVIGLTRAGIPKGVILAMIAKEKGAPAAKP
jgi:hypothetical protein